MPTLTCSWHWLKFHRKCHTPVLIYETKVTATRVLKKQLNSPPHKTIKISYCIYSRLLLCQEQKLHQRHHITFTIFNKSGKHHVPSKVIWGHSHNQRINMANVSTVFCTDQKLQIGLQPTDWQTSRTHTVCPKSFSLRAEGTEQRSWKLLDQLSKHIFKKLHDFTVNRKTQYSSFLTFVLYTKTVSSHVL